jgi:hypothetical protein
MRKLRLVALLLVIVVAVTALVIAFPVTLYVPLGALKREAFFAGRPTSYWARAFNREPFLGEAPPAGDVGKRLRDGGAAAVPVLRELTTSPDDHLRSEALLALSLMGPAAQGATPELEATVRQEKNSTRFLLASAALAKVDAAAAAAALGAIARAPDEDRGRRAWALTALLEIAPAGREAVPALDALRHDPAADVVLRVDAIHVLWRMKQPAGPLVTDLCQVVNAKDSPAGVQALHVLGEMGPAAAPAVPDLLALLDRPSLPLIGDRWGPPHRAAVVRTLGLIGPAAAAAAPALVALANHDDYFFRREVVAALDRLGPSARRALATRDAASWASVAVLAARPPAAVTVVPLAQVVGRTWVPRAARIASAIREGARQTQAGAGTR